MLWDSPTNYNTIPPVKFWSFHQKCYILKYSKKKKKRAIPEPGLLWSFLLDLFRSGDILTMQKMTDLIFSVFNHIVDTKPALWVQVTSKINGLELGLPQMGNLHPRAYLIIY